MTVERDINFSASGELDEFLDHYQLSHDPFAARTPGFRFFTPQRKTVLAQLHHLARFGDRLLLVTGPEGSGKTLLRQVLVASSNKDTTQCVVATAREFADESALTGYLCQAVNAKGRSPGALLERAEQLKQTGVQLYLIIDDAQLLELQALQDLADMGLSGGADSPIRIFLFADENIALLLPQVDTEGVTEQWVHRIELEAYSLDETRDYLAQRLEAAGGELALLDEEQLQQIHRRSSGWPGRINTVARQVMEEAMEVPSARPARRSAGVLPVRSIVAVLLVAAGISVAWWMGGDKADQQPSRTVLQLPEPVNTVHTEQDRQLAELTELNAVTLEPDVVSPEPATAVVTEAATQATPPAADDQVSVAPVPAEVVDLQTETAAPAPAPVEEAPALVPAPPAPAPAATPAPAAPTGQTIRSTDWYRQASSDAYVLQLLGTRSRDAALSFIQQQSGLENLGYFETEHEGRPWFVVTQGLYGSRQQAQQGISKLPEVLRKQSPWPRGMGAIQQSLR
ncbi:AAA family ATPase [Halopseudomonas pelagia]|uniref:AAA family ATPase n=1 Tax=Halopseudomonas pelagia TaxID=553151 RepID=UPI00039D24BA|nr:AAA family ATPase [Halopseudomonas pelagia]